MRFYEKTGCSAPLLTHPLIHKPELFLHSLWTKRIYFLEGNECGFQKGLELGSFLSDKAHSRASTENILASDTF